MPVCQLADSCLFYQCVLPDLRQIAPHLETIFCCDRYSKCARYRVHRRFGQENVPLALFPNDSFNVRKGARQHLCFSLEIPSDPPETARTKRRDVLCPI